LTGIEMERVETLLRERSAEMTRTRDAAQLHPSLDGSTLDIAHAEVEEPAPVADVAQQGACIDCGDGISSARLAALPDAVRCVGCQRQLESQTS
jgi:RNA polymerase-binding transcription factor DksA